MKTEIEKEIEELEKGCGRNTIWNVQDYTCGSFEDLKHSDHIILCDRCQAQTPRHTKKPKEFLIKKLRS